MLIRTLPFVGDSERAMVEYNSEIFILRFETPKDLNLRPVVEVRSQPLKHTETSTQRLQFHTETSTPLKHTETSTCVLWLRRDINL
jgi:hypothetical protein